MSGETQFPVAIDEIIIGEKHRSVTAAAVKRLADSIEQIGLRHPITVRERGEKYSLVAGRHRLEAFRKLGRDFIPATIVKMSNDEARLWEISENLHRADLTKLERDEQVAEWIKITERLQSRQAVANESKREDGRGHRQEGGIAAAARELGIDGKDAERAVKVASLSEEAKEAAREHRLENNRAALLDAASKPTVAEQVAEIHRRYTAPRVVKLAKDPISDVEALESQVAALMNAWNKASSDARQEFLGRIDSPLMDQRFG